MELLSSRSLLIITAVVLEISVSSEGSRILLIPAPIYSHCLEISSIGHALVARGHDVQILFGKSFEPNDCHHRDVNGSGNIQTIVREDDPTYTPVSELNRLLSEGIVEGKEFSLANNFYLVSHLLEGTCANVFYDKNYIEKLRKRKFDLVIIDGFRLTYCMYIIPYKLDVPYISASSNYEDFAIGRPFLPGLVPSKTSKFTDEMSFFERLQNAFQQVVFYYALKFPLPREMISSFLPEMSVSGITNLVSHSELFLQNTDHILSFPTPVMPNIVHIGGICTQPAKPLTDEFNEFYERSRSGVIVVTFGSMLGVLPKAVEGRFFNALKRLKVNVVLKYSKLQGQDGNIYRAKWVPQNDLLGHNKTVLFISHCGNNGLYEALYHGVPLLCTPLFADQFHNAKRVERLQVGSSLGILSATEHQIYDAITDLLSNSKYIENMQRASAMYHSQPLNAREKAAFWVEYILRFGGAHLRSKASEMSPFTYMGMDLVCFVLLLALLLSLLGFKISLFICRFCLRKMSKVKTE